MQPKVSVVVPIYKVEKYLNRCVDSILNQTYKNIEVILVDDGSPDKCGDISDNYSINDKRVISVHKENGGLSDARNYGMKYVSGEYTIFLDSDDWVKENMIEELVNTSIIHNVDVVQSGFYYAYEDYLLYDNRYYDEDDKVVIFNKNQLMKELVMNEKVKNFAWGKLYKTSLINNVPFEKGVLFEDVFWAHEVMDKVSIYAIVHKPLCYYMQRSDSIVATYTTRNLDIIKGLKVRHKFIEKNYKNLVNESLEIILKTNLLHYYLLQVNSDKDKDGVYRKEIKEYINENYNSLLLATKNNRNLRLELVLFKKNYYLSRGYVVINKILNKLYIFKKDNILKRIPINNSNS